MTTDGSNGASSDHRRETALEQIAAANGNGHHRPRALLPPPPGEEKRSLDPGLLVSVFLKWWRVTVPSGLALGACLAALTWFLHTQTYRATLPLKITEKEKGPLGSTPPPDLVANQRALLRMPFMLNKVLAHKEVAQIPEIAQQLDPAEWLRERVEVKQEGHSSVFIVSCELKDPVHAALVLNTLIDEYLADYFDMEDARNDRVLEKLEEQRTLQRAEVANQQKLVDRRMADWGQKGGQVFGPFLTGTSSFNPKLQALTNALVGKQIEKESAGVELALQRKASKPTVSNEELEELISAMPTIQKMEGTVRLYEAALKEKTPGSAAYNLVEADMTTHSAQLKQSRSALREQFKKFRTQQIDADRQKKIDELVATTDKLDAEIVGLKTEITNQLREEGEVSPARLEASLAYMDLERAKSRLSKIEDEIWQRRMAKYGGPSPVAKLQLQKAAVPKAPVEAIPYKKMAGFSLMGLVVPFGLCVLVEFFTRRLFRSQQVGQEVHLPLLGEVATLPKRPRVPRPGAARRFERDRSVYEESVDSLRATLAVCDGLGETQVLVVASAVSGEGKSTLAARLAFSWARGAGERVLLIDADLRAPDLHKFFEIDEAPGLGEVLLGEVRSDQAIVDWGHGLHVMPAGRVAMSPHRLFSTNAFHDLIAAARKDYGRIVIDIPPILGAGESLHVAKEADGVLLCARKDVSRVPQVKMACNRLELSGARILGCVFIGVASGYYSK